MLPMVCYSRRPQSGQITCYFKRTYHVLPTLIQSTLDVLCQGWDSTVASRSGFCLISLVSPRHGNPRPWNENLRDEAHSQGVRCTQAEIALEQSGQILWVTFASECALT